MYAHYDASTGNILGFYSTEIHGGNIPEPHIEITKEQWKDCLAHQVQRKVDVGTQTIMEHIAPSPFHGWNGQEWVFDFNKAKEAKYQEIASARWQAETAGIAANGLKIKTDRESQAMITGAALQAIEDSTYSCQWKTEGGFVTLVADEIKAVARAVRAHVQACFDKEAVLIAQVEAVTTEEELNLIKW